MIRYVDKYCPVCGKQLASVDGNALECLSGCELPKEEEATVQAKTLAHRIDSLERKYDELDEQVRDLLEEVIEVRTDFEKKFQTLSEEIAQGKYED